MNKLFVGLTLLSLLPGFVQGYTEEDVSKNKRKMGKRRADHGVVLLDLQKKVDKLTAEVDEGEAREEDQQKRLKTLESSMEDMLKEVEKIKAEIEEGEEREKRQEADLKHLRPTMDKILAEMKEEEEREEHQDKVLKEVKESIEDVARRVDRLEKIVRG